MARGDGAPKPTLALYFDNATMDEASAAKAIHIIGRFFGERLEVVEPEPMISSDAPSDIDA